MKEQEQNELLEAALALAGIAKNRLIHNFTPEQISSAVAAVEKFRPAPAPRVAREWWINRYASGTDCWHTTESSAASAAGSHFETVHVREVLPDEVRPERWKLYLEQGIETESGEYLFAAFNHEHAVQAISAHNRSIGREEA